jgi:hypothetical protein
MVIVRSTVRKLTVYQDVGRVPGAINGLTESEAPGVSEIVPSDASGVHRGTRIEATLSPLDVAALDQAAQPALTGEHLRTELLEIYSELGVAIVEMLPSDEQIIANHIRTAYTLTGALLRQTRGLEVTHAAER